MFLHEWLAVLDAGDRASAPQRALQLAALSAVALAGEQPDPPPTEEALAAEPVGRTTARLLRLRQHLAGPVMEATVPCPACTATVEFSVDTRELLALDDKIVDAPSPLLYGEREIDWRPVSYADLVAALDEADPATTLLERCSGCEADELTAEARAALVTAMSDADPLLELDYDLACPQCGAGVRASVDAAAFVWAEVEAQAKVLLAEVDLLARTYGWSEAEILGLPPQRRARYVDLVSGAG